MAKLTKPQARAILTCATKIRLALDACLPKLSESDREYALSYWAGHLHDIIAGRSYGSMPIGEAENTLYPDE